MVTGHPPRSPSLRSCGVDWDKTHQLSLTARNLLGSESFLHFISKTDFIFLLQKVLFLQCGNGSWGESLALWFLMTLEQKQKQFWKWNAKRIQNPAGSWLSVIVGAFCPNLIPHPSLVPGPPWRSVPGGGCRAGSAACSPRGQGGWSRAARRRWAGTPGQRGIY